jgi:hypothetical protein
MPRKSAAAAMQWPMLASQAWMLGAEASWVIWLRCARMAQGGAAANSEARLMVTEKVQAQVELATALAAGSFGTDPGGIAASTMSHYSKAVRANRSRLTR